MNNSGSNDIISQIYSIADELRALANLGLSYSKNEHDRERYEKVLLASASLVGLLDNKPSLSIENAYRSNYGYITPLIGAEAAVFRDKKLLMIKRHDDGLWAVPGGMVEVGETLANAALRELKEETGLVGEICGLLGIFDSRLWKTLSKSHLFHVIFEVNVPEGDPIATNEATEWGFFSSNKLPNLSPGHDQRVPVLFKLKNGEMDSPYIDNPDQLSLKY